MDRIRRRLHGARGAVVIPDDAPAPVFVLLVVRALMSGDIFLARWAARQATLARVSALLDDEIHVDMARVAEPPSGRMVGVDRCEGRG